MGAEKGKGKALREKEAEAGEETPQDGFSQGSSSMLSRIAASASGLTKSALATPGTNELNAGTASALANAGKPQSSGQGGSATWAERDIGPEQRSQNIAQQIGAGGFKLGHHEEHVRKSENEFMSFLDGIDSFTPSQDAGVPSLQKAATPTSWGEAWARSQLFDGSVPSEPQKIPSKDAIAEQESRDGEEVLAILSGPIEDEKLEDPETEDVDWNLNAEQISQLRAMTKDLFPPTELHNPIPSDHPLNLIPDFGASNIMKLPQTEVNGEESYIYIGLNRDTFKEQWEDVLTRYSDEVWGDLLPLVKEARQEVEQMGKGEPSTEEPQALRRLRAILAHLKR